VKEVDLDLHKFPAAIRYKFLELLGIKQKTVKAPDKKYRLNLVEHFRDDNREDLKKRTEWLRKLPASEGNVVSDASRSYQLTSGRRPFQLLKFHNSTCFVAYVLEPVETTVKGVYNLKWAVPVGSKRVDREVLISGERCVYGGKTFAVKGYYAKGTKIEIECETFNLIFDEDDETYRVSSWAPRFIEKTERKPMTIDEIVEQAAKDFCLQLKVIRNGKIFYLPGKSGEEKTKAEIEEERSHSEILSDEEYSPAELPFEFSSLEFNESVVEYLYSFKENVDESEIDRFQKSQVKKMAVIGSRDADPQMIKAAQYQTRKALDAGWGIVTGGAKGIDEAAIRSALPKLPPTPKSKMSFYKQNVADFLDKHKTVYTQRPYDLKPTDVSVEGIGPCRRVKIGEATDELLKKHVRESGFSSWKDWKAAKYKPEEKAFLYKVEQLPKTEKLTVFLPKEIKDQPRSVQQLLKGAKTKGATIIENAGAKLAAREKGIPHSKVPYAQSAFARNKLIISNADAVVAVQKGSSAGTQHSINYALNKGLTVKKIDEDLNASLLKKVGNKISVKGLGKLGAGLTVKKAVQLGLKLGLGAMSGILYLSDVLDAKELSDEFEVLDQAVKSGKATPKQKELYEKLKPQRNQALAEEKWKKVKIGDKWVTLPRHPEYKSEEIDFSRSWEEIERNIDLQFASYFYETPYDPTKENNEQLADSFRLMCAHWSTWVESGGKGIKFTREQIIENTKKAVEQILKRVHEGKMKYTFHPGDMKRDSRNLYDLVKKQIGPEKLEKLEVLSEVDLPGIYLISPHAEMIWTGAKNAIVKSRKFEECIQKPLYLVSHGKCYGIIKLSEPEEINKDEFAERYSFHLIEDYERQKWWDQTFPLYYYEVEVLERFPQPKEVNVLHGIQTFLKEVEFKTENIDEFSYSRKKCMKCDRPPEYEVLWAEGMGHAWFCSKHLKEFYNKHKEECSREGYAIDIDAIKKIDNGIASEKFRDNKNPIIHSNNFARLINQLAEPGAFQGWLGGGMGGRPGAGMQRGRMNSPTFAYKTLYQRMPETFLPGRSGAPQKTWRGVMVDVDMEDSWLEQLNSIPEIEIRSTEQGKSELRPAFVVFRLRNPENDDKAKAVASELNKIEGLVSQSDIGGEGRPRIVVVSRIWKDLDFERWKNFWEKLPGHIKSVVERVLK